MADAKLATGQEINPGPVGDYIQRSEQGRASTVTATTLPVTASYNATSRTLLAHPTK